MTRLRRWLPCLPAVPLAGIVCCALIAHVSASLPAPAVKLTLRSCPAARPTPLPPEEAALRIELNSATYAQLISLPGIGEKMAAAILAYREENGGFRYVEELMRIRGIGPGKLNAIYDLIYIDKGE